MEEEKLGNSLKHKTLLILIKYSYHIIALFYVLYDILGLIGIDAIILGYISHVSILNWFALYFLSIIFRYCYVHRLPLYYILLSEILTVGNYLLNYSVQESYIMCLHLVLIAFLIFGYTYYYLKTNAKRIKKRTNAVNKGYRQWKY